MAGSTPVRSPSVPSSRVDVSLSPGDIRRWNVPDGKGTHFLVLEVEKWSGRGEYGESTVTFLSDGWVIRDDATYIKSISGKVSES